MTAQPEPAGGLPGPAAEEQLRGFVEAAQRAAGVIGARHRGDAEGVAALLDSFASEQAKAGGFLLLAELSLQMYREQAGQSMDACVQELCLHLDAVADRIVRSHPPTAC